ncbi:Leucyl aminopeptidase yscIV [Orbilia ellipsospora]|uniref:Peptide hydrolase n=1 Tax=Orbilia ellipsospora TaxID=2528407 RepID=A0AAV9X4T4_9PEZI
MSLQNIVTVQRNITGASIIVDGIPQTEVAYIIYSKNGNITAPVTLIPNFGCNASDFSKSGEGRIALVNRGGDCDTGKRLTLATAAGASGFILWDQDPTIFRNSFTNEIVETALGRHGPYDASKLVPSAVLGFREGQALVDKLQLKSNPSNKSITVIHKFRPETVSTVNLIATTKGGNQSAIITVGAHSDSVHTGPGINDDGTGVVAQIEVARALSKYSVNNAIRFCWWSAEEEGLKGSAYYADHLSKPEAAKIVMNLNFDMIGSPNNIYGVFDGGFSLDTSAGKGRAHIEQTILGYFKQIGKPTVKAAVDGRSDYGSFMKLNIPTGGIFTGAEGNKTVEEARLFGGKAGEPYDPCYHKACDNTKNVNYDAFLTGVKAFAYTVAKYAQNIEGVPFPR